jgi:hypothetical protein
MIYNDAKLYMIESLFKYPDGEDPTGYDIALGSTQTSGLLSNYIPVTMYVVDHDFAVAAPVNIVATTAGTFNYLHFYSNRGSGRIYVGSVQVSSPATLQVGQIVTIESLTRFTMN